MSMKVWIPPVKHVNYGVKFYKSVALENICCHEDPSSFNMLPVSLAQRLQVWGNILSVSAKIKKRYFFPHSHDVIVCFKLYMFEPFVYSTFHGTSCTDYFLARPSDLCSLHWLPENWSHNRNSLQQLSSIHFCCAEQPDLRCWHNWSA